MNEISTEIYLISTEKVLKLIFQYHKNTTRTEICQYIYQEILKYENEVLNYVLYTEKKNPVLLKNFQYY